MTKEEFEIFKERFSDAVRIDQKIKMVEASLSSREIHFGFSHNFNSPDPIDISFFINSPEIKAINEKIYSLVRNEYEILLEQLKAEFAALT